MRLVTFSPGAGDAPRAGVLRENGERVVDLGACASELGRTLPFAARDMISLISAGDAALDAIREVVQRAKNDVPLPGMQEVL